MPLKSWHFKIIDFLIKIISNYKLHKTKWLFFKILFIGSVRNESFSRYSDGLLRPRCVHQQHRLHHPQGPSRSESLHLQHPSLPHCPRDAHHCLIVTYHQLFYTLLIFLQTSQQTIVRDNFLDIGYWLIDTQMTLRPLRGKNKDRLDWVFILNNQLKFELMVSTMRSPSEPADLHGGEALCCRLCCLLSRQGKI